MRWPIPRCARGWPNPDRTSCPREQQTPQSLGAYHKAEVEKWGAVIKATGVKAQ